MDARTDYDHFAIAPIAYSIEDAPQAVGVSRTRIFEAVRSGQLAARKAGRSTLIEVEELRRWVKSLPTRGCQLLDALPNREIEPARSRQIRLPP